MSIAVLAALWVVGCDPPPSLFHDARIVPVMGDGHPNGLRLSRVRRGGFFDLLGLRDGDVVREINGEEVKAWCWGFYEKARAANVLTVRIVRDGRPLVLETSVPLNGECFLEKPVIGLREEALMVLVRWRRSNHPGPPPLDSWGRPVVRRPPREGLPGCDSSLGLDGRPGTPDDVLLGCARALRPDEEPRGNVWRMLDAARRCEPRPDEYGRPLHLLANGPALLVWSTGPDRKKDTSDDEMLRVDAPDCLKSLRRTTREDPDVLY